MYLIFQESAQKALRKYGVGSCGPRGFYGTMGRFFQRLIMREIIDLLIETGIYVYSFINTIIMINLVLITIGVCGT